MPVKSFRMPAHACNAHLHIIDPAYPNDGKAEAQIGTVSMYRRLAEELQLERAVFVQAKPFGTDNTCLTDAIARFGAENARGIAVVQPDVTDAELEALHAKGVRGLRYSVWNPSNAVVSIDGCPIMAERVKAFGWNIQIHSSALQIAAWRDMIASLPTKVVIDHMGRMDPHKGRDDPAFRVVCELIDRGNTWVKLSGPYLNTAGGAPWDDATALARAFAEYAPERVVWGSDYPHVTEKVKPSEAILAEMISQWLPTERSRELALVRNPEEVYGFRAEA